MIATDKEGWCLLNVEGRGESVQHVHGIISGGWVGDAVAIEQDKVVRYVLGKLRHQPYCLCVFVKVVEYESGEVRLSLLWQAEGVEVRHLGVAHNLIICTVVQNLLGTHSVVVLGTGFQSLESHLVLYVMADGLSAIFHACTMQVQCILSILHPGMGYGLCLEHDGDGIC